MSNLDLVQATMRAFATGDVATADQLLTDDFTFSGPVPQPLNKQTFLGFLQGIHAALSDWNFNATDWREEGDRVYATFHISATHTGTLAVIPGVPPVPATGKHFQIAPEHIYFTVRNGKIAAFHSDASGPDAGVPGTYAAVGAPLGH